MPNIPPLAPNALSTLAHVKAMLEIPAEDVNEQRDTILVLLINSVSAWIERMTGRNLGKQTYTQRYNASGAQELALLQWPILSVDYVKDVSAGNVIPPEEYDFTTTGQFGVLYNDKGWPLRGYRGGLSYDIAAPMRCLEVKYTAGYVLPKDATDETPSTLPYDLQGIVWGAIMQEFSVMQNGAQGLSAFSISDVSWTFDKNPREQWLNTIHYYTRL